MGRVLRGAIAIRGRVFRAGQEEALERAAEAAGVDLSDPRYAAVFGKDSGTADRASAVKPATTVNVSPSVAANLKTAQDVQAAFTVREAERYLSRVGDATEVKRLAKLDKRASLKPVYAARLEELK